MAEEFDRFERRDPPHEEEPLQPFSVLPGELEEAEARRPSSNLTGSAPMVGRNDPPNSFIAAERMHPKRNSAAARVLAYLQERPNQWVEGHELTTPQVGGSDGLRRARDLRKNGWPIENRPHPEKRRTTWQYRLVVDE